MILRELMSLKEFLVAGDMFADMPGDQPHVQIVGAPRVGPRHHRNGLALVKITLRVGGRSPCEQHPDPENQFH